MTLQQTVQRYATTQLDRMCASDATHADTQHEKASLTPTVLKLA
jgi:hypothetical protein